MTRSRDTASIIPTVDAKGDLLVGTADNTIDNLSPGTNGQVLTANSATATGLEWITSVPVASGGTGATTLASGGYLKGAGTSAITAQAGIPAGDVTSGTLSIQRFPSANWGISSASATTVSSTTYTTIASVSLTTRGNPVLLSASGDMNPTTAGGWNRIRLFRGATAIGNWIICQSTAASVNVPFGLTHIDPVSAGTYTYTVRAQQGSGTCVYGEEGAGQAPTLIALELF
jgi:hypothetical protein